MTILRIWKSDFSKGERCDGFHQLVMSARAWGQGCRVETGVPDHLSWRGTDGPGFTALPQFPCYFLGDLK